MSRNVERMRYKNDAVSPRLCILAIACNVAYFITIYSSSTIVPDYPIGVDVIVNILFMLITFWASEQAKVYDRKWSYGIAALGLVQIARMFWLPELYHRLGQFEGIPYHLSRWALLISAVSMIVAACVCYVNSTALLKYLKSIR